MKKTNQYELHSLNKIFRLVFYKDQKMNLVQSKVLSKIVCNLCQEQKMNFIQKIFFNLPLKPGNQG